ncbi:heme o synthase [Amycolatopsis acidiphila]|uniref:Protoheme IX farnesyltransferase n=1 Tax=Amycolatopsis acidiphila TaxID=715473 RepID=A0A558A3Z3_9PSEU|nr:heme o synthase [Amycolatopsis acidiphila]TVT18992.1 protoheme IX farnesyltransferase [Amycolatopsis acidiphila]UIJ56680.1 heme o synthase [Amycolatopsis acidiphila]GHG55819.1 protoheme IX farnesyltransferase [Amycolatopsis acidiphila]
MSLVNAAHGRSERTSADHPGGEPPAGGLRRLRGRAAAYLALTKPQVIELLLVTTIPAMFLAARTIPSPWLIVATLVGGAMAAGSANTLNCVIDADIDKVMNRTKRRPLVRDSVPRRNALVFGLVLGAGSFLMLFFTVNLLAAVLAIATILFYIFVYTLGLKRRTAQNVVWGGAAGCMPVVIGWAAVTGTVQWPAFVMFGVIFFWTPPHTWALGMKYRDDYERAGVPMLPVVATPEHVARQIVIYSWVMVAWTLLLLPVTSWLYASFAVLAGAWFLFYAHSLQRQVRRGVETKPMALFHRSNTYLMVVFCALAVDSAIGLPALGLPF